MRTIIFMILLLSHTTYAHAATKTLTPAGQNKLLAWAQKVARIYGTALKNMPPGVVKTEDLDIYFYARSANGLFTTSGFIRVNYTNRYMTFTPTCMGAGTSDTQDNLHCISNLHPTAYKDYGAYASTMPVGDFGMDPYEPQTAFGGGHGACLGNRIKTINLSCLIGVRKYVSSKATTNLWAILSTKAVGTGCQAAANPPASISPVSSLSCTTKVAIDNIKSTLKAYKDHLVKCNNGVLPAAMNIDLTELEEVLNDIENGYLLADEDIQGDTNPPAARNPWTFTNPTLAAYGGTSQTYLVGNLLPEKLKVRVTNAEGNVPLVFSVADAPSNDWSFPPVQVGQPVTLNTVNGTAETGFRLGMVAGSYPIKASCTECCPNEVPLTATALTTQQATKLREMFCDGAHFVGRKLPDPLRVKAVNLYTNKGEKDFAVTFSQSAAPLGIIHTPITLKTADNGLAKTDFTLGAAVGNYTITARCELCLAGQEVQCLVKGIPSPDGEHNNPSIGLQVHKSGVNITTFPREVYPQGAGGTPILAQVTITGASNNTLFTAQVVAGQYTGGHQHVNTGAPDNRPKGTLAAILPTVCSATNDPNIISCATDANGGAKLTYTSSEVGGWDNILVKMATGGEGDVTVKVRVPDLRSYPRSALNHTSDSNTQNTHPNFLYGTQTLNNIVDLVASQYKTSRSNLAIISVNDMSLINGGLMDISANWSSTPKGHKAHRKGTSVDINSSPRKPGSMEKADDPNFVSKLTELFSLQGCGKCPEEPIHYECPRTVNCP